MRFYALIHLFLFKEENATRLLYTSEDPEVHTYIAQHWKALDAITNNNCDYYPVMTQYNSGDGYDFLERLDPVRLSKEVTLVPVSVRRCMIEDTPSLDSSRSIQMSRWLL